MQPYEPEKYRDEVVNGITVRSQLFKHGPGHFGYRVSWDGGYEEAYGYRTFDSAEQGMSDAFARAMENGRIGGVSVPFNGFPISQS